MVSTDSLRSLFQNKFDYKRYCDVVVHSLMGCRDVNRRPQLVDGGDGEDKTYFIGKRDDAEGRIIGFFYTEVAYSDVRRKRVGLRQIVAPYLRFDVDAAVAVFDDGNHWRLSYICDMHDGSTSSKRFSYIMGDSMGQYRTPVERLSALEGQPLTLALLRNTFSVEALSDEFFREYHQHYDIICKHIEKNGGIADKVAAHDYAKKMLGRIVFLHFLQKKGWLCGDSDFMLHTFQNSLHKDDYLEQVLEPLFFGVLNTEPAQRAALFKRQGWDVSLLSAWQTVPYLNGGLFESDAIDRLRIVLPSEVFDSLFRFLASYNFTVDENDPDDAEVGVDPEMLGKIFESLLEDNKAQGAYYTPKEIVRYMCRESLVTYLMQRLSEQHEVFKTDDDMQSPLSAALRQFVEHHEVSDILVPYRTTIIEALREVKICDPAIGSGAFPMGLLNVLWRCREALSEEQETSRAELKKEIIQNNIYGVDIERGAIDIARLRFWLSIVVDSDTAEPLPNFDYKFMQGNSLIESYHGIDLSTTTQRKMDATGAFSLFDDMTDVHRLSLRRLLENYYRCTDHKEKNDMRHRIAANVCQQLEEQGHPVNFGNIDIAANSHFFLWHTWFYDVFAKGGFDIVIGNPPYGAKLTDSDKAFFRRDYITASTRNGIKGSTDTYTLFIERGCSLLSKGGCLAFIVPVSFTSSDSLAGVHSLLMSQCDTLRVSSYAVRPEPVFKNAVVDTSIVIAHKTMTKCRAVYSTKMHRKKGEEFSLQTLIDNLQYVEVKAYMKRGRIPKIGTEIEKRILDKLSVFPEISLYKKESGSPIVYRFAGGRYFKVITPYSNNSSAERTIYFDTDMAYVVGCMLSSSLSFWFCQIFSDNHNWKNYEVDSFPVPNMTVEDKQKISALYQRYLTDIEKNANVRVSSGMSSYNVSSFKEYKIVRSKHIIDEIDDFIGPLYGLTQEEIDFIKNYELVFRMAGE